MTQFCLQFDEPAMKKFLKNLSFGVDIKLQIPPLTYKINSHNMSAVRSQAVILTEEFNEQLCMYVIMYIHVRCFNGNIQRQSLLNITELDEKWDHAAKTLGVK